MNKKIILIVGASGVGKDSLLKEARKELEANFIRRYITRMPDENESNFFLEKDAFTLLSDNDYFASSWEAHNNFYGIGKKSIIKGLNIISISRAVIKDFEKLFDDVYTINITLNKDELKSRLIKRERESLEEIEMRLNRSYVDIKAQNLIEFKNDQELEKSKRDFITLLQNIGNGKI